ncbi:MAG: hypothetical protein ACE37B_12430 [Ilumatobacter sp.]|uniref:hypothetical protein n=1 Tax=Ilumatobacter sp. TaxID=1967498 RepID=UPI003919ABEB
MAGYLIGIGLIVFALWRLQSHRKPTGATEFTGTVVEEVAKKSSDAARKTVNYAPRVSYQHPGTGTTEIYEPTRFGQHRFAVGERTTLFYDAESGKVTRPLDRPKRETSLLLVIGVGFIAAQYFSR